MQNFTRLLGVINCEECRVESRKSKIDTQIYCCVCQEKDLKSYMEECGNILNINNVKVVKRLVTISVFQKRCNKWSYSDHHFYAAILPILIAPLVFLFVCQVRAPKSKFNKKPLKIKVGANVSQARHGQCVNTLKLTD